MIENALAVLAGGIILACGIARGVNGISPSLRSRQKTVRVMIEGEDGGYMVVEHPRVPNTADELLERIGKGIPEPEVPADR